MLHQDDGQAQRTRFQSSYLIPQLGISSVIGTAAVFGGWFLASQPLLLGGVIVWLYAVSLLPAIWLTRRGQLRLGVWIAVIGLYLVVLGSVLVAPVALSVALLVAITGPVVALPYVDQRDLRIIGIVCIATAFLITVLGRFVMLFPPLPEPVTSIIVVFTATTTTGLTLVIILQFAQQLIDLLARANATNRELLQIQSNLETTVNQRTSALSTALADVEARAAEQARLLEENTRQRSTIAELGVPVLPVSQNVLVLPLVGALDDERLQLVHERALQFLARQRANFLILDVTGIPLVDSRVAAGLIELVQASRLLGATVVLVGVRPEVSQAIVSLGIDLRSMVTRRDLQSGLEYVRSRHAVLQA